MCAFIRHSSWHKWGLFSHSHSTQSPYIYLQNSQTHFMLSVATTTALSWRVQCKDLLCRLPRTTFNQPPTTRDGLHVRVRFRGNVAFVRISCRVWVCLHTVQRQTIKSGNLETCSAIAFQIFYCILIGAADGRLFGNRLMEIVSRVHMKTANMNCRHNGQKTWFLRVFLRNVRNWYCGYISKSRRWLRRRKGRR